MIGEQTVGRAKIYLSREILIWNCNCICNLIVVILNIIYLYTFSLISHSPLCHSLSSSFCVKYILQCMYCLCPCYLLADDFLPGSSYLQVIGPIHHPK